MKPHVFLVEDLRSAWSRSSPCGSDGCETVSMGSTCRFTIACIVAGIQVTCQLLFLFVLFPAGNFERMFLLLMILCRWFCGGVSVVRVSAPLHKCLPYRRK